MLQRPGIFIEADRVNRPDRDRVSVMWEHFEEITYGTFVKVNVIEKRFLCYGIPVNQSSATKTKCARGLLKPNLIVDNRAKETFLYRHYENLR